jgi:hypothetical protein
MLLFSLTKKFEVLVEEEFYTTRKIEEGVPQGPALA